MPTGANRGTVTGIPHWPGVAEATREKAVGSKKVSPAHIKKAGRCLSGVGGRDMHRHLGDRGSGGNKGHFS